MPNDVIYIGMKPTKLVLDYIATHLTYDPTTGTISKKYGKSFGTLHGGYMTIQLILDTKYEGCALHYFTRAHQVAWYITYGVWPDMFIDHIDGNKANNRLSNLRLATCSQNTCNQKKSKRKTTSQYKGVYRRGNRWGAYCNNKRIGSFSTEAEAAIAYNTKAVELYGEYACLNVI